MIVVVVVVVVCCCCKAAHLCLHHSGAANTTYDKENNTNKQRSVVLQGVCTSAACRLDAGLKRDTEHPSTSNAEAYVIY
jgi:hypothetical protein